MLANPGLYDGRRVTIYGLVIESSVDTGRFLLQDVSQMPLAVRAAGSVPVKAGDQVLVQGLFHATPGEPILEPDKITHTKVLGGGGCC